MKYLIASDLHGSIHYTNILINRFNDENAQKLVLLGDLYYHGPRNPLPLDYSTMECAMLLNQYKDNIIAVRGNCDAEVDQMISDFRFIPYYELDINGKKIFLSHGHLYNQKNHPETDFHILIYGHEHTGYIIQDNNKVYINTGSVSLPKNNTPHSYILIDDNTIFLKELQTKNIINKIFIGDK